MYIHALIKNFKSQSLNLRDLVALSSGHTIGAKTYNATNINPAFAKQRKATCPRDGGNTNLAPLDPLSTCFDISYFENLVKKKTLLISNQTLFNGGLIENFVKIYNHKVFWDDFAK
ncbi:peroxidase 70 [Gossypium australe]|uniref:peroxidase n=1 Tax=Gossypium australe TaxID=47621 RepID=A0A5B6WE41_9ROSI|nr:peroxidase 70 [Gossypium australe]